MVPLIFTLKKSFAKPFRQTFSFEEKVYISVKDTGVT